MKECSKSVMRRSNNINFLLRYFKGDGLDIGGAPDPLNLYQEIFPLMTSARTWDRADGDAEFLNGIADESFDFVHSSHCLEHLNNPGIGLANWFRVLKPTGYLVITVPDEDLYEQGVFPSTFNRDHKWTFTIFKEKSWSPRSLNMLTLLQGLGPAAAIENVQLIDGTYRYSLPRFDQTLTPVAESAIEAVVRKRDDAEIRRHGAREVGDQPGTELRIHLNQYVADHSARNERNQQLPPFSNSAEI
jgi:SAM-dependent methyltransferase